MNTRMYCSANDFDTAIGPVLYRGSLALVFALWLASLFL